MKITTTKLTAGFYQISAGEYGFANIRSEGSKWTLDVRDANGNTTWRRSDIRTMADATEDVQLHWSLHYPNA